MAEQLTEYPDDRIVQLTDKEGSTVYLFLSPSKPAKVSYDGVTWTPVNTSEDDSDFWEDYR